MVEKNITMKHYNPVNNDYDVLYPVTKQENVIGLSSTIEGINTTINEQQKDIDRRELKDKLFKKSIFREFPLWFDDYDFIVSQEGVDYIYPQSFTIDWETREIFFLYEPGGGTSTKRWVVVRHLDTGQYLRCFHAGNSGGEGIVVKWEGNQRYLYVKTTHPNLGKFNITNLPTNRSSISPIQEYNVGLAFDFSYRNGLWLIEQGGPSYGTYQRRTTFVYFNESFNPIGSITISPEIGGYFSSPYEPYIAKRQGIALHDDLIIQSSGGSYRPDQPPVTPYGYQGLKIMTMNGELIAEGLMNPEKVMSKLSNMGYFTNRVENEGIHISPDGEVYTLMVHQLRVYEEPAKTGGLLLMKEFSDDPNVIDWKDTSDTYPVINRVNLENGSFPRHEDGKMYDPYTAEVLDTLDKILDFMQGTELKQFSFFTNEVDVFNIDGTELPENTFVIIRNTNNWTFSVTYKSTSSHGDYMVWGASGNRTIRPIMAQNRKLTEDNGSSIYRYGVDLDTITTTGWYYIDSQAPNNPNQTYGFLQVISSATTHVQFFYPVTNNDIYYKRTFNNGSYSAWRQVNLGG